MSQNAQKYAPRKDLKEPIAEGLEEIFGIRNILKTRQRTKEIVSKFSKSAPESSNSLENKSTQASPTKVLF